MDKIIIHQIAAMALYLGFLDEVKYRNYCIKEEFEDNIMEAGKSTDELENELGVKYSLSPEYIHQIVYKKKEKEQIF
jgi:hypothetical protein